MSNHEQNKDVQQFAETFELWERLHDKIFLITGATGLIGSVMIRCLLELNRQRCLGIRIVAVVRNLDKARQMFEDVSGEIDFRQMELADIRQETIGKNVDYIIHCAAPTSSKYFVEHAVETFDTIIEGTSVLLRYAKNSPVKSFVYLSSLEVYGSIYDDTVPVTEDVQGYLDPMSVRSSYPMAKRAAENLCCLYAHEYGVPVKVSRLTQTTGAGIAKDDNRVIAQFTRLAAEGKDIVLHTTGEAARPYCYTTDAISGILYILLNGVDGEAYNVANEDTYISARGMADYLKKYFNPNIAVQIDLNSNLGYAPSSMLKLSVVKLRQLGWSPKIDLHELFNRLTKYINNG